MLEMSREELLQAESVGDGHEPLMPQHKGVRPGQEDPLDVLRLGQPLQPGRQHCNGVRVPELGLTQIMLNIFQRGHPEREGQIVIEGAEFTSVMGAARCDFKQQ